MNTQGSFHITAIIPAYNAGGHIARSLDSVLKQTLPADEIIVVDDGSSDDTAQVVRSFGDKVTLLQQANAGVSRARNAGIRAAAGDWIAFLDADDEWLPERLASQVALLKRNPDLVWVTGNYLECLCRENRTAAYAPVEKCRRFLNGLDHLNYLYAATRLLLGHTDCMLIKKEVLLETGLFCPELPIAEDIDLWLRIAYRYPQIGFLPQPLSVYHLTVSNSLMTSKRSESLYKMFIRRHFELAGAQGVLEHFLPAGGAIMRRWIRGMLFQGRRDEIRELVNQFPRSFSPGYRAMIYALTAFPALTVSFLRILSKLVRSLKLRRRLTRPPQFGS